MPSAKSSQSPQDAHPKNWFDISLAQWSLHRRHLGGLSFKETFLKFGAERLMDNLRHDPKQVLKGLSTLDFPQVAVDEFGLTALDFVNIFFFGHGEDTAYLKKLRDNMVEAGTTCNMIMIDGEGSLGEPDKQDRLRMVENHYKWIEATAFLGGQFVRVNAHSTGPEEKQHDYCVDGLAQLADFAADHGIDILVENHGGLSSNAEWLVGVIKSAARHNLGTLPDFGNFKIDETTPYDPYKGVAKMMPYAKAVSAKSYDFTDTGDEQSLDYLRLINIIQASGFGGYIGVEYEGTALSESDGILATKKLLQKLQKPPSQPN